MFGINKKYETRELWVEHDVKRVFGVLYTPKDASKTHPVPAVICSHFFGGTHRNSGEWAQLMAEAGFVAYAFDFCGGSVASRSTGKTTECSIKTEAADLSAILDTISDLDLVDSSKVFLLGQSQGGAVSAMVAAERPADVRGLILLYPAFVIHEDALRRFGSVDKVPETYRMWQELGRVYGVDALEYDFYEHIGDYTGPVRIYQGTADTMEPPEFTERAAKIYQNATLTLLEGEGHGFFGTMQQKVADEIVQFVRAQAGPA